MIIETVMTVGDFRVLVVRKNIKNLHLGVYPPDGRLRMAVPLKTTDDAVRLMIVAKTAWLKKQIAKFAGQQQQSQRRYVSGESYYLNGQR